MPPFTKGVLESLADPAADYGVEIRYTPRPEARITSSAILDEVSLVLGLYTPIVAQYQPPGSIYYYLLKAASISHNQSLAAAIQKIRAALDLELDMMKATNNTGNLYWTELMYRRLFGSYAIYYVGNSVVLMAKDTTSITEATLSSVIPSSERIFLEFQSCDVNFPLVVNVKFNYMQDLHQYGAIFLRNHEETETSRVNANISTGVHIPALVLSLAELATAVGY
ncbi:hypothetical protein ACJ72_03385 [Emergomyces africanus]|uniref:Uncharacterized protein n=1 Tax=Emergomyces africanus TaxID=1955775 RepID=A0A1B7NZQ4_9EURO|nr:hypothetical protein ACJ72_03385 [Emergomyces africanus]